MIEQVKITIRFNIKSIIKKTLAQFRATLSTQAEV